MRQTVIALRLADLAGADQADREPTCYLGLLMNAYCHPGAAEQAAWFGDDISIKRDGFEVLGMNTAQAIAFFLRRLGVPRQPDGTSAPVGDLSRGRLAGRDVVPDDALHP